MNDLEDRLRTTLHDRADTLPPTRHARAMLDRRLTERGGHRPLLVVAAVVAVVVVGIAVPLALTGRSGRVASPPGPTTTRVQESGPPTGEVELGRFTDHGVEKKAVLTVTAQADGEHYCLDALPSDENPVAGYCGIVPSWPTPQPPGSLVLTRPVLGDVLYGGPLPKLMLFVTAPQVTDLEVREAYGRPVEVRQVTRTPGAAYYLAEFPETYAGLGYTARDSAGNVLENAIT
ncbi:hypothetical protein [Actinophytocola oryzae]|uniref:Uncharacterized protein n=1 Tax=Actinophytocola oryzae TaxID=502181 RepID=A0A4V3FTC1_9PSEU|nr:hypothetical protein [Actinophytocola oryzae]TDV50771.1 hypothetical protein CLV71_106113 [Actinophytocola oryzae]